MYIKIRVSAGAKKESVRKRSEDHFEVSVKEEARQNMANRRMIEVMAGELGVPKERIRIVSGHHSPSKIISVR